MQDGEIQSLVVEKGFGFIKPADGGANVFFHYSVVDTSIETLTRGQKVQYELDTSAQKPRARSVRTGRNTPSNRPSRPTRRPAQGPQSHDARRPADRGPFKHGFVTKLHRTTFRGFIASTEIEPEYLFLAENVIGEKRFSRLEIGDYVQFLVADPDPADPKQPMAKAVRVVKREVMDSNEKQLGRHPKARGKKPTWR